MSTNAQFFINVKLIILQHTIFFFFLREAEDRNFSLILYWHKYVARGLSVFFHNPERWTMSDQFILPFTSCKHMSLAF